MATAIWPATPGHPPQAFAHGDPPAAWAEVGRAEWGILVGAPPGNSSCSFDGEATPSKDRKLARPFDTINGRS
jgi:hypothetical protein